MMKRFGCPVLWGLSMTLAVAVPGYSGRHMDTSTVLVVVNDSVPPEAGTGNKGASQYVADRYVAARGIPPGNVVHIRTTMACCESDPKAWDSWNIPWSKYVTEVREPIKAFLTARGWTRKIQYIVPTYGVPSHIWGHPCGADGLSVDSFLAIMNTPLADSLRAQSPLYDPDPESKQQLKFRAFYSPFYVVTRLDGPSAEIAAGLVDKAIAAEQGISRRSGAGYFDWRHLATAEAGYYVADQTMLSSYGLCVSRGMQCRLNDQAATGGMITGAPDTLWAWGWYSGGTVNDVYGFVPGAVGAQLTSYTAGSIRNLSAGAWVPVWLERGITATWGATGEPYVSNYATGDVLLNRMWNGVTFGDAAYLSCPTLAWKMVFVGDPLYSPKFID